MSSDGICYEVSDRRLLRPSWVAGPKARLDPVCGTLRPWGRAATHSATPAKVSPVSQILLDIPEDSLLALRVSAAQMGEELRMAAAVKLFELGRLSAGAAAELAGVPKPLFLVRLADYGVAAFRHSEDDLRRDLANA